MNWVTHRRLVRVNGLLETSKEHFRKSTMPGTTVASRELVRHAWIFDMLKAEPANMMFTDRGKERGQEEGREDSLLGLKDSQMLSGPHWSQFPLVHLGRGATHLIPAFPLDPSQVLQAIKRQSKPRGTSGASRRQPPQWTGRKRRPKKSQSPL